MKLHTLIKHNQTICHAQEPYLWLAYFWSNFPLIIFAAILCLLNNLKTVKDISVKLQILIKHNETICHAQEL